MRAATEQATAAGESASAAKASETAAGEAAKTLEQLRKWFPAATMRTDLWVEPVDFAVAGPYEIPGQPAIRLKPVAVYLDGHTSDVDASMASRTTAVATLDGQTFDVGEQCDHAVGRAQIGRLSAGGSHHQGRWHHCHQARIPSGRPAGRSGRRPVGAHRKTPQWPAVLHRRVRYCRRGRQFDVLPRRQAARNLAENHRRLDTIDRKGIGMRRTNLCTKPAETL